LNSGNVSRFYRRVQGACDIAVIGSGFAGSLIAMIARKQGRSVILLEKGKHPRFAIGESSTPLANLILEELCERYSLDAVRPLTKWGTWQRSEPALACGLKRGFTFFRHAYGQPFPDDDLHQQQLLVAASPNDAVADTHWFRADFDAFLVEQACKLGVTYLDEADLWGADFSGKRAVIQGRHQGRQLEIHAEFVIDASGPRGFLQRALELPEVPLCDLPPTEALYNHFTSVKRWDALRPAHGVPPYAIDDAAVHHVFDDGWMWILRFNNGITSAGAAVKTPFANELKFAEGAAAWEWLLEKLPAVREQFAEAKPVGPFVHAKRLSFLTSEAAGPNWALLPSAAGFIDPLLSTGFPLTLLGIERLARILETHWQRPFFAGELFQYSMQTTMELAATEHFVAALYANLHDFEVFSALTLLYFAAASFTEAARRLGKPELAGNTFLLGEHPKFGSAARHCIDIALTRPKGPVRAALLHGIRQAIEPVNIAGLARPDRHNWYPALAEDLLAGAAKLNSTRSEIESMLRRCGL
jgi:tetracycline 7-halogenase / FADH2 O2-dependent halogenase